MSQESRLTMRNCSGFATNTEDKKYLLDCQMTKLFLA